MLLTAMFLVACAGGDSGGSSDAESDSSGSDAAELDSDASSASANSTASAGFNDLVDVGAVVGEESERYVVCVGDSITYGYGAEATRENDAWPYVLDLILPEGYTVLNYGVGGAALQEEAGKPYITLGFFEQVKEVQPYCIIFMLGTNDSYRSNWNAPRFQQELDQTIEKLLEDNPGVRLVLMAPPRVFMTDADADEGKFDNAVIGGELRDIVRDAAERWDLEYIDMYAFTENHPEWFPDLVHPNSDGNRAMAVHIAETLSFQSLNADDYSHGEGQ